MIIRMMTYPKNTVNQANFVSKKFNNNLYNSLIFIIFTSQTQYKYSYEYH